MKLYNSLTRHLDDFQPISKEEVTMYVCGITPYDTTHLGHAFTYMTFDVLQRYLKHLGYKVKYVQNVTDIDDDILKKAKESDQDWKELGNFWTEKFLRDLKTLDIQMPTNYVKATEAIPTMITIIKALIEKGFAYEKDGNVYFEVKKDAEYGKLSRYSRAKMIKLSKERGADPKDPRKKNPLDFILWQKSLPTEPYWESKWSKGRPGWHIECSAMVYKYIDNNIDIHGGGSDLIYPHHESEIAQSESFTDVQPFSKFWMHTGAVGYQGEKMSKSLGNLVMVSDLLKTYSPDIIRYLLLSHHYREPWEFKEEQLKIAEKKVSLLTKHASKLSSQDDVNESVMDEFTAHMQNDLNTPKALQIIEKSIIEKNSKIGKKMSEVLGFSF